MDSFASQNLDFTDLSSVGINPAIIPNQNPNSSVSSVAAPLSLLPQCSVAPNGRANPTPDTQNNNNTNSNILILYSKVDVIQLN